VFTVGLNPYGLAYTLGVYGIGTPRANPAPWSVHQYVDFAESLGVNGIELHAPQVQTLNDDDLHRLHERFTKNRWWTVLARPLWTADWPRTIQVAKILKTRIIRSHLTPILCGDRTDTANPWPKRAAEARRTLLEVARQLADHDLKLAIENHQDFCSEELVELCESAGSSVGITLDTANPLAVGEDPVDFAKTVAPKILHLHLKDYVVQWTDQGYRLIRCPTGSGCIPFKDISQVFGGHDLTAGIEVGALDGRHIKCLAPDYWTHHPPRTVQQFSKCLRAARCGCLPETQDIRTPWEKNATREEITAYELDQVSQSVQNVRQLGWL
jgi:sugar phosphate isomerase/epimerase